MRNLGNARSSLSRTNSLSFRGFVLFFLTLRFAKRWCNVADTKTRKMRRMENWGKHHCVVWLPIRGNYVQKRVTGKDRPAETRKTANATGSAFQETRGSNLACDGRPWVHLREGRDRIGGWSLVSCGKGRGWEVGRFKELTRCTSNARQSP